MKPASGSIPEEIAIIKAPQVKVYVGCPWEVFGYGYHNDEEDEESEKEIISNQIEVTPAFICDASSAASIATGKKWAGRYTRNNSNFQAVVEVKKNIPIENVAICSLETRGAGGRAYKVIADGLYVDCREDVIVDVMLQEGVDKGGILRGKYIWIKTGAHSRLVRVGSTIHEMVKKIAIRKELKEIPFKDLKPGTIYATKKDNRALFLGVVNSTTINNKNNNRYDTDLEFTTSEVRDKLLFVGIPQQYEKNVKKWISKSSKDEWNGILSWTQLLAQKKHNYVEAIGSMEHEGLIEALRERARERIKEAILATSTGKNKQGYIYHKGALAYDISRNSTVANMYDITGDVVEPFDYEPLLNFI